MVLNVAARSVARQAVHARGFRSSAVARSAHDHVHPTPFAWPSNKAEKVTFGTKVSVFLAIGFAIPFVASVYQLKKAGGASD